MPSTKIPCLNGSSILSFNLPLTRTRYRLSQPVEGNSRRLFSSPSFVSSNSPSEFKSSLPIETTLGSSFGRLSKIVGRFFSSFEVETRPTGLLYIHKRVCSGGNNNLPSTSMTSFLVRFSAGLFIVLPFTLTRPSRINFSDSLLLASPALAMILAMRSPLFAWCFIRICVCYY